MATIVKLVYKKETGKLDITCSGRGLDVSNIKDLSIEQWVFPFVDKGVKWNGLYEELRAFTGCDSFTLQVDCDDTSFDILKYALRYTPLKLERLNNINVTMVYSENPFVTRILINGQPFDTDRIQNRSIDEWILPINIRGVQWLGIFKELENYLNSESYTIFFVGDQMYMNILMNYCPESVSVFYRDPKVLRMVHDSEPVSRSETGPDFKSMADNFSVGAQKVKETVSSAVSTGATKANGVIDKDTVEEDQESDLKTFLQKNFVVVCAVLLIVFLIFPFMRMHDVSGSDLYIVESTVSRISGFGMIFGVGVARINSAFAVGLIIAPIWMALITYFKPLKKYENYLIFLAPVVGILFGFLAYRDIKHINDFTMDAVYYGDVVTKTAFGIGFILTLVVYIIVLIRAIRQCRK